MRNSRAWVRLTALAASLAFTTAGFGLPVSGALAQEESSVALEQARSGEDGSSGSGANSGNTSTGNAGRDKDGNAGSASAGSAGEGGTTESAAPEEAALPENADLLAALGILEIVDAYNLSVLDDSDIAVELLPPPAEPVAEAPSDINSGGQAPSSVTSGDASIEEVTTGESSTIATEPGSGGAPATGATGVAAPDGIGATNNGDNRQRRNGNEGGYEAPGG